MNGALYSDEGMLDREIFYISGYCFFNYVFVGKSNEIPKGMAFLNILKENTKLFLA